jgi:hypothetical protein
MADPRDKEFFDAIAADDRGQEAIDTLTNIVAGDNAIERAIEWIGDNMDPQSVFSREKLDEWARLNGYHQ